MGAFAPLACRSWCLNWRCLYSGAQVSSIPEWRACAPWTFSQGMPSLAKVPPRHPAAQHPGNQRHLAKQSMPYLRKVVVAQQTNLLRNCHQLSRDGRIRTIGLSVLVSQLALPLQRSTSFFHSRVACVRAMDFLARPGYPRCAISRPLPTALQDHYGVAPRRIVTRAGSIAACALPKTVSCSPTSTASADRPAGRSVPD